MPQVFNPKTGKPFLINVADVPAWTKAGYVLQMPSQEAKPSAPAPAPAAPAQPAPGVAQTILDKVGQGISANSDELTGAGRAAMGAAADKYHELKTGRTTPLTPALDYHAGRDASRARLAAEDTARPLTSKASELAGGIVGGTAAMAGGVPGMAAYGAQNGLGRAQGLDGEAMKDAAKGAAIDGGIAAVMPGSRAASVLAKTGPGIWMRRMGATPAKLGFETLSEAKAALGELFAKNPQLLKSTNLEEFLGAAKSANKNAGSAMREAYAARGDAPVATRAQLYSEIEKSLEHMPAIKEKFLNNVARSADKERFIEGLRVAQERYGHGHQDAEQLATELLKGDKTPMQADEVQNWLNELKKVAQPKGAVATEIEAKAPGQTLATKAAHQNATGQFNAALDPASLEARKTYGPTADLLDAAKSAAKKEPAGSIIPHGSTLPAMAKSAIGAGETHALGTAQKVLQSPSAVAGATGVATGALPVAAQHFAGMAKSLGLLDIPDATDRAARDMLLSERHSDYSDARREAAKEHDQHQAELDQQAEKAK